jgi:hypothetical protein
MAISTPSATGILLLVGAFSNAQVLPAPDSPLRCFRIAGRISPAASVDSEAVSVRVIQLKFSKS